MITGPEGQYLAHPRQYCVGRVIAQALDAWNSDDIGSFAIYCDTKDWLHDFCGLTVKQGRVVGL